MTSRELEVRKIPFYRRIIFKALVLLSMALLLTFGASFMITVKLTNKSIEQNLQRDLNTARLATENFIGLISRTSQVWAQEILYDYFFYRKLQDSDIVSSEEMLSIHKSKISADSIILLDKNGIVLFQEGSRHSKGDSLKQYDVVKETLRTKNGATRIASEYGKVVIYSSAFIEEDHQIQGIVLVGYYVNDAFLQNIRNSTHLEIAVVENGIVMSSTRWGREQGLLSLPFGTEEYRELLASGEGLKEATVQGRSYILSANELPSTESSDKASLLFGYPYDGIQKQRRALFREQFLLFGLIFLLSLLFLSAIIIKYSRILNTMSQATKKVSNWRSQENISIDTHDELELLAESFNTMTAELNTLHSRMEEEIEKKTKALREQKKVHELMFDNSADGILILDDGTFTDCNQSMVSMLGYDNKEEVLELGINDFSPQSQPDGMLSSEKAEEMIETALKDRGHRFEWVYTKRSGEESWAEIELMPIEIEDKEVLYVICRDISGRKKLESENAELNRTLEMQIETALADLKKSQSQAKLGSWKLDIVNNRLTWSDEAYNIFEMPKSAPELSYEGFLKAIHPDDVEKVNAAYAQSLETRNPYEIKHRIVMADGRIKHVKEQCETTFAPDGKPLISVGTIQDITDEYLAAEELRRKDEMLFRQSRLAQMGEMISLIAHQWRQPLNAISLTTAALELKLKVDELDPRFFQNRLERIADYVQHLSSTIEDFRDFFRPEKERHRTSFSEIIEKTMGIVGTELENLKISVRIDCRHTNPLFTYTNELLQVTLNLIKNAEDALLENQTKDPVITVRCYADGEMEVLEVQDNGGGIDESLIKRIFDPYVTTKEEHSGTGLGLYMSRIIIEEHCGGTLVASNVNGGALFRITIKRA